MPVKNAAKFNTVIYGYLTSRRARGPVHWTRAEIARTTHNYYMRKNEVEGEGIPQSDDRGEFAHGEDDRAIRTVPPAVVGFLLLVIVVLACAFYITAQVVQTP